MDGNMLNMKNESVYHVGDILENSDSGIWLDFRDDTFLFVIKDDFWQKDELSRLNQSNITISLIQKGIVDAFVIEIFDVLEASDIPFYVKDGDQKFIDSIDSDRIYTFEVIAVDKDNSVVSVRHHIFDKDVSNIIHQCLRQRLMEETDSTMFEKAYDKLSMQYEPYALLEYAKFTQVYQKGK